MLHVMSVLALTVGVGAGVLGGKKAFQFFGAAIAVKFSDRIRAFQTKMATKSIPQSLNSVLGNFHQPMDQQEAAMILGLKGSDLGDPKKIKEAHRRLAKLNHPDSGGSHYLASKINEAKTVLVNSMDGRTFTEAEKTATRRPAKKSWRVQDTKTDEEKSAESTEKSADGEKKEENKEEKK